jgi:hypothetical protein
MSSTNWKWAVSAAALIASHVAAIGQGPPPAAEIADLPSLSTTGEGTASPPGEAMGPARDFRVLWADPAIQSFVGMAENGWDFNKPDEIPGFGSLPQPGSSR